MTTLSLTTPSEANAAEVTLNRMESGRFTFTGSMQKHPKTWAVCFFLWVFGCWLNWKWQAYALERSKRPDYTMYLTSESPKKIPAHLSSLPWYSPQLGSKLTPECKDLLQRYARIPIKEQEAHIKATRDFAFQTVPLAAIGEFWFLFLGLAEHPKYSLLIRRLVSASDKSKRMLLDIGTCLGQDLRKLALDGADPSQLAGADKVGEFEGLGFSFFGDNNNFANVFMEADIFSESGECMLVQTIGTWEVVTSSMFLDAFDWQAQVLILKKMIKLVRGKGCWMMGLLAGDVKSQEVMVMGSQDLEGKTVTRYLHNETSLARLFKQAQVETGVKLSVEIRVQDKNGLHTKEIQDGYFATDRSRILFYFVEFI